jgi:hypothetical protein
MGKSLGKLVEETQKWISSQPRFMRLLLGAGLTILFVGLVIPFTPNAVDLFFYVIGLGLFILWAMFFWRDFPPDNPEE